MTKDLKRNINIQLHRIDNLRVKNQSETFNDIINQNTSNNLAVFGVFELKEEV